MRLRTLFALLIVAGPAGAQSPLDADADRATIEAAIRAELAQAAQPAAPGWADPAEGQAFCGVPASAACARVDPVRATKGFCDAWTADVRPEGCARLAQETPTADPARLARAIALAQGDWTDPDPDTVANADEIIAQARRDARALTDASAAVSRRRPASLDLSGAALAVQPVMQTDRTLETLFPDGLPQSQEALQETAFRVLFNSDLSDSERERVLLAPRERIDPGAAPALPPRPSGDVAGLVADPMACEGLGLPDTIPPLQQVPVTLPSALHGAGPLAAVVVFDEEAYPLAIWREGVVDARIFLPMHPDGLSGGDAAIVLMRDGAEDDLSGQCPLLTVRIGAPQSPPGAFTDLIAGLDRQRAATNALAEVLGTAAPFPTALGDPSELRTVYQNGSDEDRASLDAIAAGLVAAGLDPAAEAREAMELTALITQRDGWDDGRFDTGGPERLWRANAPADLSFDVIGRTCAKDVVELQRYIRLGIAGRYAGSTEGKLLLTGASTAAGVSAKLAIRNKKAGEVAQEAIGLAFTAHGIFMDYLKGMMPTSLSSISADVANEIIYEDEPDLRVEVTNIVLKTKSDGWDATKAGIDVLLALLGSKGVKGPAGSTTDAVTDLARQGSNAAHRSRVKSAFGDLLDTSLAKDAREAAGARLQRLLASEEARTIRQEAASAVAGTLAGQVDGEVVNQIYGRVTKGDNGQGLKIGPISCEYTLEEDWAWVSLDDPNLAYMPETFGIYRPVRQGRAVLSVKPRPERIWGGLELPEARYEVSIPPLMALNAGSPGAVQPGDTATLQGEIINSGDPETHLTWRFLTDAARSHTVSDDTLTAVVQTVRQVAAFPLIAEAYPTGSFLSGSDAPSRAARFVVQAGELWLVPTRDCINPGGAVQIYVFDARTGQPVPPRELVFHTDTRGLEVDASGILRSARRDDYVTVTARGVGANGWRGQTRLRADCSCGTEYFDPGIVVPAGSSGPSPFAMRVDDEGGTIFQNGVGRSLLGGKAPGMQLFALQGEMSVAINGDVTANLTRPFALDLVTTVNDGPTGPACQYLTGGISPLYLGTQMLIASPGLLLSFDPNTGGDMPHSHYREPMGFSLDAFDPSVSALMAEPRGPTRVAVEEWRNDRVVITVSGAFSAERMTRGRINVTVTARFVADGSE